MIATKCFLASLLIAAVLLNVTACDQVVCHNEITHGQMTTSFGTWNAVPPFNAGPSLIYTYRNDSKILALKIYNGFVPYNTESESFFSVYVTFYDLGLARFLRSSKYLPLTTTTQGFVNGDLKYQTCVLSIAPGTMYNNDDPSVVLRVDNLVPSRFANIRFIDVSVLYGA